MIHALVWVLTPISVTVQALVSGVLRLCGVSVNAGLGHDEREEELRSWLAAELAPLQGAAEAVVVVKETRAYWVYPLWQRVAEATGAEVSSLTMLRHPTQVVRSRDSAYLADKSDELRRKREVANVAAWMNSIFVTERATRDNPRAFVPYYDLIGDWRAAMTRACGQLGLDPGDLTAPHDVDDFLTTSLNRSSDSKRYIFTA